MKNILNKRLKVLSAFIKDGEIVLDIGCDHGLLGIYLMLNRENIKVISSDINPKPLLKAKENIHKYGLEKNIETRLGDGLEIMSSDVTTVVISGMGGMNIINILKYINNYPNVTKLVLSPNTDFPLVRKSICDLGFMIKNEDIVLENGKFYLISEYLRGREKTNYYFGKLDLKSNSVKKYYQEKYYKNKKILSNLSLLNKIRKCSLIKENMVIRKNIL